MPLYFNLFTQQYEEQGSQGSGTIDLNTGQVIYGPSPIDQPTEQINTTGPDWEAINKGIEYNQYLEDLFGPWGLYGRPPGPEPGPHYVGPDMNEISGKGSDISGSTIGAAGALLLILAIGAGALR